jgi:hypothetical protein
MDIENKYKKWYLNLISSRKSRVLDKNTYYEKHHILPKSLGGDNSKDNLIYLTSKEHFVAHLLLIKMYTGPEHYKMKHAFSMMLIKSLKNDKRIVRTSNQYKKLRQEVGRRFGIANKGRIPWNKGIKREEAVKQAVSLANKGKTPWNKGITRSDADVQKMKEGWKIRQELGLNNITKGVPLPKYTCEYCNKTVGGLINYKRWHGNNCKEKNA